MMIIAGGRTIESLYMGAALTRLSRFPNVVVVPVCSTPQNVTKAVNLGRPTDFLPPLVPTDVVYVCGAPGMVDSVKSIAGRVGAACYADPFVPTTDDKVKVKVKVKGSVLTRAMGWLSPPSRQVGKRALDRPRSQRKQTMGADRIREARGRNHFRPQST
jgi:3-phenylpropionate/trans-cinnamate dioxygenase ferredoxin reductase subunit